MKIFMIIICILVCILIYAVIALEFLLYVYFQMGLDPYLPWYPDSAFEYTAHRPSWVPKDAFVINMHAHTRASDGLLSPHQLVRWHILNGYNGCAITDHNSTQYISKVETAAKEIAPEFVVIPGVEATSMRIHLNIYGTREFPWNKRAIWYSDKAIKRMIDYSHKNDYLIQVNHRHFFSSKIKMTMNYIVQMGFDGVEVRNSSLKHPIDEEAEDFIDNYNKHIEISNSKSKPLFKTAGLDFHSPNVKYRFYTEILSEDHTTKGVLNALRQGKTRIIDPPNMEKEKNRLIPESNKLIPNPKMKKLFLKWIFLSVPGLYLYNFIRDRFLA